MGAIHLRFISITSSRYDFTRKSYAKRIITNDQREAVATSPPNEHKILRKEEDERCEEREWEQQLNKIPARCILIIWWLARTSIAFQLNCIDYYMYMYTYVCVLFFCTEYYDISYVQHVCFYALIIVA